MPFKIIYGDITKIKCDAIVNPTNSQFVVNGGIDEVIRRICGNALRIELEKIKELNTGHAVITNAYNLPCKKIIHVSSPEWLDGLHGEDILLASCYAEALRLADENNIRTIAFPLIAGGSNGFPYKTALSIAKETLQNFVRAQYDLDVLLVMYDNLKDDFGEKSGCDYSSDNEEVWLDNKNIVKDKNGNAINKSSDFLFDDKLDKSFSEALMEFLLKKNVKNVDCYKRANLDRKLFSKIINGSIPKKRTIFALCIALKLSLSESESLLNAAGYTFSQSFKTDLIVEYFIVNKKYNIYELNGVLRKNNLPMLGSI